MYLYQRLSEIDVFVIKDFHYVISLKSFSFPHTSSSTSFNFIIMICLFFSQQMNIKSYPLVHPSEWYKNEVIVSIVGEKNSCED